jgi:hypothetical protein
MVAGDLRMDNLNNTPIVCSFLTKQVDVLSQQMTTKGRILLLCLNKRVVMDLLPKVA